MGDNRQSTPFRRIFKSGSIVFVGFVIERGVAFFAKALAARELAQAEFGSVAAGLTVLATMSTLTLLGLNKGVVRYLPRFESSDARRGVVFSALQVSLPVSILCALGVYLFADTVADVVFNDAGTASILQIFALAIPFSVLTKIALGVVQGEQLSLPKVYIENITIPISRFAFIVGFVLLGLGAVGVAWGYVLPHMLAALFGLIYLYRRTDLFRSLRYVPRRREMLFFSAPLIVTGVMARVLSDIDVYLIGYFIGIDSVATYNVIYPIAELIKLILISFGYLIVPMISELHAEGSADHLGRIYLVATKWIVFGTLPLFLGVFLFPELSITLAFGSKYADGALALQVLAVGSLTHAIMGPNSNALIALGKTNRIMYYNIVAAMLNIIMNLLLIPRYGITGAAVATFMSYMLVNLLYSGDLYRTYGVSFVSRSILVPSAATIAIVGSLSIFSNRLFADPLIALIGVVVPAGILYPIVLVQFGDVGSEEMMIIESIEDRFDLNLSAVKRFLGQFA
jgi:O-antigen/teichoic acid export membrane protein